MYIYIITCEMRFNRSVTINLFFFFLFFNPPTLPYALVIPYIHIYIYIIISRGKYGLDTAKAVYIINFTVRWYYIYIYILYRILIIPTGYIKINIIIRADLMHYIL